LPTVSVIVPCLGHARELRLCLDALQHQEGRTAFEVIVVDSAADPKVKSVVKGFPDVQLRRSKRNLSAGAARNLGVKHARGTVLAFIDADCIPSPGWVRAAARSIRAGAMIVGGPILDVMPWHLIASTDNRLQFADYPKRRPAGQVPYVPGAHLAVRRSVFKVLAGFDEGQSPSQDVRFTTHIAQRWPDRVRFEPQMSVWHHGRSSWPEFFEHQRAFGQARAEFGIRMDSSYVWLGRRPLLAWIVVLRRLAYITVRVLQWSLPDLPRYVVQLPFVLAGLIAWTAGFYVGMRPGAYSRA